jgi:hypothetical protein
MIAMQSNRQAGPVAYRVFTHLGEDCGQEMYTRDTSGSDEQLASCCCSCLSAVVSMEAPALPVSGTAATAAAAAALMGSSRVLTLLLDLWNMELEVAQAGIAS